MITQEFRLKVEIPNGHLSTIITRPKEGKLLPSLVFLTGSGGVKERFLPIQYYFASKGFYSISIDFRGRGESSGKPLENTLRDQQFDLKHIFSFITYRQPVDQKDITVFGTSMGAFVAASVSDELPIKNLILSAPAIYLPQHEQLPQREINHKAQQIISDIKGKKSSLDQTSSLSHIANFQGNLLLLEHQKDNIIPQWLCQTYSKAAKRSKRSDYQVLENVEHSILTNDQWKSLLSQTLYDWITVINQPRALTQPPA